MVNATGLGFGILAACFHFLAFFSAFWDCQTHIDASDWGTVENLPEENIIQRPDPPVYEIQDENLKHQRALYETQQEQELHKKVQEIEKRKQEEEKVLKAREKLRKKEHAKRELAREKLQLEEEDRKLKEEKDKKELERKRLKDEMNKLEQELEKKLGETAD
ncbi:unnamed protein product [Allacma fusca]|uniref:Uncharacterized protein n=1 Tax=Allacma fusca TaxID=39272 RepID=A0A8J2K6I0_9HEXA|nr:unnamed protein product [Allacma fusca]